MSTLSLVAAFQHGFKIIPVIQGLISSQDKLENFARNLASVQGVGRHSLDSAKICSKSFPKFGELPISLLLLRYLLPSYFTFMKVCRVHRCFMDPAKPSSKPVVSYHLLKSCLTLVFFAFMFQGFIDVAWTL